MTGCKLFDDGYSTGVRWYLIVVFFFWFASFIIGNVEHLLMCLLAICMSSLEKCLLRFLAYFLIELFVLFSWIFSYRSCLCILEINPLLVTSFANIFSHSVGYRFVWFPFAVQKFLSLIRFHLFPLAFIFITLWGRSTKILLCFMSKSILPVFL